MAVTPLDPTFLVGGEGVCSLSKAAGNAAFIVICTSHRCKRLNILGAFTLLSSRSWERGFKLCESVGNCIYFQTGYVFIPFSAESHSYKLIKDVSGLSEHMISKPLQGWHLCQDLAKHL